MKKGYLIILFFLVIVISVFSIFSYKNDYILLSQKKYENVKKNNTMIVYVKKGLFKDLNNKILLSNIKKKNKLTIYEISSNNKNTLIFIKNGKIIHSLKKIDNRKIKKYIKEIFSDVCTNKKSC